MKAPLALAALLLGVLIVVVAVLMHRPEPVPLAVLHERSQVAKVASVVHDTIYREAKAAAAAARVVYRTDTLPPLTDTVRVLAYIARADTVILRDSIALVAADSAITAHHRYEDALVVELAAASVRPRFTGRAAALYEPLTQVPAASAEGTVRLFGKLSALVRAEQRFALGEQPRLAVGFAVAF